MKFKNCEIIKKKLNDNVDFLEILKLLSYDLYDLHNCMKDIEHIFDIWEYFFNIYISIKDNCYPKNEIIKMVTLQTFSWLKLFEKKYHSTHITPYEHVFGEHLGEMIERFGNVNSFNMQGLERLNGLTTNHYYTSTNKHQNFLFQLINKRNRLETAHFINLNLENWEFEDLKQ